MCGFSGLLADAPRDELAATVTRMAATLEHRGPDADGLFAGEGIALGHRRLKIIDLTETGAQPMTLGAITIAYNGECYNFRELRTQLTALGHQFRGPSDTEVLLHAYDEWGVDGLTRLEGIFGLALWDASCRRLVLMRDRLGVKPLFYAFHNERLAFGSEIKAVLAGLDVPRDIDQQALSEYLWYGNSFEERTIYRDIKALRPGYRLLVEDGHVTEEPWWQVENWLAQPVSLDSPAQAADAVRDAVDRAVARQLVSDVPVCVFLSGGIDSSAIAAAAARAQNTRLTSYAVGFDFEGGVNELPKARRVADHLGLDHHELRVSGAALEEVIDALVGAHDEPFADAANIPLYLLAQKLNGTVKVALQGDGGDEMFAGYRRYALLRNARFWQLWPAWLMRTARRLGGATGARVARLAESAGHADAGMRMALLLTMETLHDPPTWVFNEVQQLKLDTHSDPFAAYRRAARRFGEHDPVQQMLLTDITLQLPSQFLPKVDRATMANGMEARVPLLDEHVGALAVGMPAHFKVSRREKKMVLRDAQRQRLPDAILDAPKTGFGVPYSAWLRGDLYEFGRAAILDPRFVERFGLEPARLTQALDEHRAQRRDRGFLLWKLLQLSLWSRRYLS